MTRTHLVVSLLVLSLVFCTPLNLLHSINRDSFTIHTTSCLAPLALPLLPCPSFLAPLVFTSFPFGCSVWLIRSPHGQASSELFGPTNVHSHACPIVLGQSKAHKCLAKEPPKIVFLSCQMLVLCTLANGTSCDESCTGSSPSKHTCFITF